MNEDQDDGINDLGTASEETKGSVAGIYIEQSVLPYSICKPLTPSCPHG